MVNSSEYATTLYTAEAERIIAHHAATYRSVGEEKEGGGGSGGGGRVTRPLFLYLPHQAVHVGNKPEA
eukprot:COSAG01_NODE_11351_length_1952_cov_28.873179_6_plen_67_part_01